MTAAHHNQRLWAVAFLLALAFLGHDVAMAVAGHATAAPEATGSTHHAAPAAPHHGHHSAPEPDTPPTPTDPDHSEDCGISRPVVPIPHNDFDFHPAAAAVDVLVLPALPSLVASWWAEPSAPPGERRARIQVWRI